MASDLKKIYCRFLYIQNICDKSDGINKNIQFNGGFMNVCTSFTIMFSKYIVKVKSGILFTADIITMTYSLCLICDWGSNFRFGKFQVFEN